MAAFADINSSFVVTQDGRQLPVVVCAANTGNGPNDQGCECHGCHNLELLVLFEVDGRPKYIPVLTLSERAGCCLKCSSLLWTPCGLAMLAFMPLVWLISAPIECCLTIPKPGDPIVAFPADIHKGDNPQSSDYVSIKQLVLHGQPVEYAGQANLVSSHSIICPAATGGKFPPQFRNARTKGGKSVVDVVA